VAVAILVGLTSAGCAGLEASGSLSQQVTTWEQGTSFGSTVGTLQADDARVTTVVDEHRGTGALHADCGVLTTDAEAANSNLPTPDQQLTDELTKAYTLEYNAGVDCYQAGATNRRLLAQSLRERVQARASLAAALSRVRDITGKGATGSSGSGGSGSGNT